MTERAIVGGPGFSAVLELDALEPLLTLVRRLGYDAELRVRSDQGGSGLLRYVAGELASGVFDGITGPLAVEHLLALRSGAIELSILSHGLAQAEPSGPRIAMPAEPVPGPPVGMGMRKVDAASARAEPAARRWLWALAPGLALALWMAVELAEQLGRREPPRAGPRAPAAAPSVVPPGADVRR